MKFDFQKDMAALKAGDRAAFNRLMECYYNWSITQARSVVHDPEQARNVALSFWEQLSSKVQHYDEARMSFLAWAEQCIKNLARNTLRDNQQPRVAYTSEPEDVRSDETNPMYQLLAHLDYRLIEAKLKGERHKAVFWLLLQGATAGEIAEECDIAESRARALIAEVRAVIQEQLEEK
jgi:RNA polymerase sigma factor (sigma-70 family)